MERAWKWHGNGMERAWKGLDGWCFKLFQEVLTMVPLYAPLQKVVTGTNRVLVQYDLPVTKDVEGVCRYEMDVEAAKRLSGAPYACPGA